MKKNYSIIFFSVVIILALIIIIPCFFLNSFSFRVNYYIDDELYSPDMYEVYSDKALNENDNRYTFSDARQGEYKIIVDPAANTNDNYGKVILEFVNCTGYDLQKTNIYMDIDINIQTESDEATIKVYDKYDEYTLSKTIKPNEDNEYFMKWTNA